MIEHASTYQYVAREARENQIRDDILTRLEPLMMAAAERGELSVVVWYNGYLTNDKFDDIASPLEMRGFKVRGGLRRHLEDRPQSGVEVSWA